MHVQICTYIYIYSHPEVDRIYGIGTEYLGALTLKYIPYTPRWLCIHIYIYIRVYISTYVYKYIRAYHAPAFAKGPLGNR